MIGKSATAAVDVVVVGAGQAGLAVSHGLSAAGVDHRILERGRVAQTWRGRWESFSLVTPNWTLRLPGMAYSGDEPEGYLDKAGIIALLEAYASTMRAPVEEGVAVERLHRGPAGFTLETTAGSVSASAVVVCTGSYTLPHRPASAALGPGVRVMDAGEYRSPDDVGPGRVLVVGSGQTGCQLAEELALAGRDVVLSCGRAPWIPRRLGDRDTITWLARTSFFDTPLTALPGPTARLVSNPQATGRDGGHDLHYRTLQDLGVALAGRLRDADGHRVSFADDLEASVAFGDARYGELRALLASQLPPQGVEVPPMPDPQPFRAPRLESVPLKELAAVIFTSGFRPDYARWIDFPVFDEIGFPVTIDGATLVAGLFFCGVHFMRTRQSGILMGVGADAALVAGAVSDHVHASGRSTGKASGPS